MHTSWVRRHDRGRFLQSLRPGATDGASGVVGTGNSGLIAGPGSAAIGSSRSATLSSSSRLGAGSTRAAGQREMEFARAYRPGTGRGAGPPAARAESVILENPQVPPSKRFCGNPACHDAQGNPTPLSAPRSRVLSGLRQALFVCPIAQAERRRC